MDTLLSEVRYSARRLRNAPAFTAVVVLTLALGIGANTAIFSVVDGVLLKPLPYGQPDRLVTIQHFYPALKLDAPVSAPGFRDYRDRTRSFDGVAVETGWNANLTGLGEPERLRAERVSGLYFRTMGVPAALGRVLLAEEDEPGKNRVVVLSDGLWKRLYGGLRTAVGQKILLNGESYDIVGVMPPSFRDFWNRETDLWTPLALPPELFVTNNYTNEFLNLTARVKPGLTIDQARRDMRAFAQQLKREYPNNFPPDWSLKVTTLNEIGTGNIRPALLVLLVAVGFVLLIACANVANLLLARSASRIKEVAIRTALGAKRWELARQLLTESVILSLGGGLLGLGLAYWSVRTLVAFNPGNIPRVQELGVDGPVMLFTLGLSVVTGILFGIAPALQTSRTDLQITLRESGRAGGDRSGKWLRRTLVVAEVALALTLLTGAGLLIKSFARLQGVDPGFDPRDVLTFNISLPKAKYPNDTAQRALFAALVPRIAQVPGVKAAAATSVLPFGGDWSTGSFNVEGYERPQNANGPWGDIRVITPGFFSAMQVPLRRGRALGEQDAATAPAVAVVDDEFVKHFYKPGVDAIGKRLWFGGPPNDSTRYITIVGVVGHTKHEGLDADPRVQLYLPLDQTGRFGVNSLAFAVRTAGDPMRYVAAVRSAIRAQDRDLPMSRIRTLDELVEQSMGQRRLSMVLLGVFAGLALLLASLGIYGVMSYSVTQRTREIGVRMALGAARGSVLGLVMRQGMALALTGVMIGLVGAFALTRLIASQLYSVTPTDPVTFAAVAALLSGIALLATFLPALRATRVDPLVALREE
ncbi:MAG: ABC transporter permease [Gemmatimonadota bacterium]|nr:ABC transporter permease [Gemmatimonadota bacterium]